MFILFIHFLKKASALRRQNAPTVPHITSSHAQGFVRFIRFIRFATSQLSVHSCVPVAHAPVTATLAWHFVPCSLRSHSFASLLRSLTHFTHFTSAPFTCFSHMSSFLLAISTIRVASQWDKWNYNHFWLLVNKFLKLTLDNFYRYIISYLSKFSHWSLFTC